MLELNWETVSADPKSTVPRICTSCWPFLDNERLLRTKLKHVNIYQNPTTNNVLPMIVNLQNMK